MVPPPPVDVVWGGDDGFLMDSCEIHYKSARRESWRRATTAILLGIAFQDLVFTEKVSFGMTNSPGERLRLDPVGFRVIVFHCCRKPSNRFRFRADPTDISIDSCGCLLNLQKTIPNPAGSGRSNQIRAYLGPGALQISIWPPT